LPVLQSFFLTLIFYPCLNIITIIYLLGGGRKIRDPEMEKKLYDWYLDIHFTKGLPVTSRMIKAKALELTSLRDFNASKGWLEKVKKKYNLQISRPSSRKTKV
jgi:hypothetical protein